MAKFLYWTGAGLGNLIEATPAFNEIVKSGHDLTVFPEDVPKGMLKCLNLYNTLDKRPTDQELGKYDLVIYSEFRGTGKTPEGVNIICPKMKWWKESEKEYHLRIAKDFLHCRISVNPTYGVIKPRGAVRGVYTYNFALCPSGKSTQAIKKWPYFPKLSKELIRRGFSVVILGDRKDLKNTLEYKDATINCGQDINIVCDILSNSEKVIANDSGPMHLANALGCKTYGIFGPTSIVKNCPSGIHAIFAHDSCLDRPCQENYSDWQSSDVKRCHRQCLNQLPISTVLRSVGVAG